MKKFINKLSKNVKIASALNNSESSRIEIIKRITDKIEIDENGCWIWQGGKSKSKDLEHDSYGRISINGRSSAVHRVMYITANGYVPNKIDIDHVCSNKLCCNPKHLEAVTAKVNQKRKHERLKS